MDILRLLLIYMAATMGLAVQSTTAPQTMPAPTPAPAETAIVETAGPEATMTAEPEVTAVSESSPAPETTSDKEEATAVPAQEQTETDAPSPTITPNLKAYHNLGMGAKGKDVRRLQERLIELRYLPKDAADGAYGRQTYNAVKAFQRCNGLKADGVAGRATQTHLYENPDVLPNPDVTAEPAGTSETEATPAPEAENTATPEIIPEITEAPTETAEPEATDTPETTDEPETTEKPAEMEIPEESEEPERTEAPETTDVPENTETPETTEKPEETTEPQASDEPEIIENVDLDAEAYEPIDASVALNEGDGPLEFVTVEDGVPVKSRPRVMQNGTKIRISLDDLCKCTGNWQITDDGLGAVVLEAAGYTLALYNEDKGCSATLDGREIPMETDDFDFATEGHFISASFLAEVLKGEAVWDQEENTLMLRIRDKEAANAED